MNYPLKWDIHIDSIVKKAQQRLYFLRQLRKFNLPQELLKQFYSAIIESVLCTSITVWFSSDTKSDLRRLRRVVRTAEQIVGTTLPTLQELYLSRVSKRAGKITLDPSHPAHSLFELLPSGRRYRALSTRTTRHRNHTFYFYFLFNTHTCYISILHLTYLSILNCLFCILCLCYFAHCLFCIFVHSFFIICVLSCRCHSVALWSYCHQNKFLVCANIPGNKTNFAIVVIAIPLCT